MRKIRCLALALLMVFVLGTTAQAVEGLTMFLASVRESGTLEVLASSGYTASDDLNFTANTENGELDVIKAVALRNEGTSWFVILEYGSDNTNENLKKVSDEIMKGISGLVLDIDDGALIPCDGTTQVNVQKAQSLRNALNGPHGTTDYNQLPSTLSMVMNHIHQNRGSLMPNVAIVVITQARLLNEDQLSAMQDTFNRHATLTTHVVCPLPKTASDDWKNRALRVSNMGGGTLNGSGYITKDSTTAEATKAVDEIRDRERNMLMLLLYPKDNVVDYLGKELTITQTTSGGKKLTASGSLSNETYELWKKRVEAQNEEPKEETTRLLFTEPSASTVLYVAPPVEEPDPGPSMELIVGIIVGVIIIALVVVLLLINKGRKKKPTATSVYGVPVAAGSGSSSGSQNSGPKVMLRGEDGSFYTGTMKNNRLVIGRDSRKGAMLAIASDGKLSGIHVMLEKQGNQLLVTDQNSMNGTKVNGTKITGARVINQNDTLGIGSHTYTVTWQG